MADAIKSLTPYLSQKPVTDFGLQVTSWIYSVKLGTGPGETLSAQLSLPKVAKAYKVILRVSGGDAWASFTGAAAIPVASVVPSAFNESASELLTPYESLCREVRSDGTISVIASATVYVSIVLYCVGVNN